MFWQILHKEGLPLINLLYKNPIVPTIPYNQGVFAMPDITRGARQPLPEYMAHTISYHKYSEALTLPSRAILHTYTIPNPACNL